MNLPTAPLGGIFARLRQDFEDLSRVADGVLKSKKPSADRLYMTVTMFQAEFLNPVRAAEFGRAREVIQGHARFNWPCMLPDKISTWLFYGE